MVMDGTAGGYGTDDSGGTSKLVLIGDRCSGKSSLLSFLANGSVPFDELPEIVDALAYEGGKDSKDVGKDSRDAHRATAGFTIVDTGSSSKALQYEQEQAVAECSAVILCMACDSDVCTRTLTEYWLPLIRSIRPAGVITPVIICVTKADLFQQGAESGGLDANDLELTLIAARREFQDSLWLQYVETTAHGACEGWEGEVEAIGEVFQRALSSARNPISPLYNSSYECVGSLTPRCAAALRWIFRSRDVSNKGYLDNEEIRQYQSDCYGLGLTEEDLRAVRDVIKTNTTDGLTSDGCVTETGFLALNQHFLSDYNERIPSSVWESLRTHGFDSHVRLAATPVPTLPESAGTTMAQLHAEALAFLADFHDAHASDGVLELARLERALQVVGEVPAALQCGPGNSSRQTRAITVNVPGRGRAPSDDGGMGWRGLGVGPFTALWCLAFDEQPHISQEALVALGFSGSITPLLHTGRTTQRQAVRCLVVPAGEASEAAAAKLVDIATGHHGFYARAGAEGSVLPVARWVEGVHSTDGTKQGGRVVLIQPVPGGIRALDDKQLNDCDAVVVCCCTCNGSMGDVTMAERRVSQVYDLPVIIALVDEQFTGANGKAFTTAGTKQSKRLAMMLQAGTDYGLRRGLQPPIIVRSEAERMAADERLWKTILEVTDDPSLSCANMRRRRFRSLAIIALAGVILGGAAYAFGRTRDSATKKHVGHATPGHGGNGEEGDGTVIQSLTRLAGHWLESLSPTRT